MGCDKLSIGHDGITHPKGPEIPRLDFMGYFTQKDIYLKRQLSLANMISKQESFCLVRTVRL